MRFSRCFFLTLILMVIHFILTKSKTIEREKKIYIHIRIKWNDFIRWGTGFFRQLTGLIRALIKPVRRRIKPDRRRIKSIHLVLICSLNRPLVFLICPFLFVFSFPKRDNRTIMMYINCLFFQDRHSEIVNYLVFLLFITFTFTSYNNCPYQCGTAVADTRVKERVSPEDGCHPGEGVHLITLLLAAGLKGHLLSSSSN